MLDYWDESAQVGDHKTLRVGVINDLDEPLTGKLRLRILKCSSTVAEETKPLSVEPLGQAGLTFECEFPSKPGKYILEGGIAEKRRRSCPQPERRASALTPFRAS